MGAQHNFFYVFQTNSLTCPSETLEDRIENSFDEEERPEGFEIDSYGETTRIIFYFYSSYAYLHQIEEHMKRLFPSFLKKGTEVLYHYEVTTTEDETITV